MNNCIVGMLLTCHISKHVVTERTEVLQQTGLKGLNFYLMVTLANMICVYKHFSINGDGNLGVNG